MKYCGSFDGEHWCGLVWSHRGVCQFTREGTIEDRPTDPAPAEPGLAELTGWIREKWGIESDETVFETLERQHRATERLRDRANRAESALADRQDMVEIDMSKDVASLVSKVHDQAQARIDKLEEQLKGLLRVEQSYLSLTSSLRETVRRAGMSDNLDVLRAIDEMAAQRDDLRSANESLRLEVERLKGFADVLVEERRAALLAGGYPDGAVGVSFVEQVDRAVQAMHANSRSKGLWDGKRVADVDVLLARLALVHTEVSEASEEVRVRDVHEVFYDEGKPCGFGPELADIVIRVFDLAGAVGLSMGQLLVEKHAHNLTRPKMHGKRA